jgi:hypothetical protein
VLSALGNLLFSVLVYFLIILKYYIKNSPNFFTGGGSESSLPLRGFSGTLTTSWYPDEIQISDSNDLIGIYIL